MVQPPDSSVGESAIDPPQSSGTTQPATPSAEPPTGTPSIATGPAISGSFDSDRTVISKDTPVALPLPAAQLPPAEMGKLLEGQRLGHFELREFVGGGGMGAVFRAHDTMLDRVVAVKVLSKLQSNDEETLRRFKNEAQSAARLDHDNIGRVHYVGEDQGWNYIVFEFIEGINLRELVDRDGPLPLADALSYTLQVADALAHASERDVVHRDIKPSNVLITPGGRAKLVDMGLARLHQVEHSGNDLTASGVTLGTFDYISPEQARDPRNADVRSDIYSLGCTVYFMLTARPPFPDGTVLQKLLQHQSEEPTDPRGLRADLPDDLLRILRRMLVKAPNQRYQEPAALMRDLIAVANNSGLPTPATISSLWPSSAQRRRRPLVRHLPWLAPVAVLLVASLIVAIVNRAEDADGRPAPIRRLPTTMSRESDQGAGGEIAATNSAALNSQNPASATSDSKRSDTSDKGASEGSGTTGLKTVQQSAHNRSKPAETSSPMTAAPNDRSQLPPGSESQTTDGKGPNPSANSSNSSPGTKRATATGQHDSATPLNSRFSLFDWLEQQLASLAAMARRAGDTQAGSSTMQLDKSGNATASPIDGATRQTSRPPVVPFDATSHEQRGILVVSRSHDGAGQFGSLAEACRAAKSGEAIELRYNGSLDSRPINLAGQRLTIRSGDGFAPSVSFRPRETDLAQSHSMIVLGGGQLTLINVQLELPVPRQAIGESLTLGEIRPGESIRLESCVLTIRNAADSAFAYQSDVAFFEIRAVPGAGVMTVKDGPMMRSAASLQMKNCVARGEALFIRANEAQPAQIAWENGILATTERFLTAAGGPSDPRPPQQIQIDLRHVTAFVGSGLVSLSSTQDAPLQLPVEINASDCILLTKKGAGAPLVDQSGVEDPEDLRKRIAWNGDRDFYEGFTTFWRMAVPGGAETAVQMPLSDWQGYWGSHEARPTADRVIWRQLPPAERAVNLHIPGDYALGIGENPARAAASDGRDAGAEIDQLPVLKE
jgi:serine/threonine-protein kinase